MKVMVILKNKFGLFETAALAARLGMTLTKSGCFAGMLTPAELQQVRDSGLEYTVNWKVTSVT